MIRFSNLSLISCNFYKRFFLAKLHFLTKKNEQKKPDPISNPICFFPEKTEWKKQDEGNCKIPF